MSVFISRLEYRKKIGERNLYIPTHLPSYTKHMRSLLHKRFAANSFTNLPHRKKVLVWKVETSVDRLTVFLSKKLVSQLVLDAPAGFTSLPYNIRCPIAGIELEDIEAGPEN